MNARTVFCFFSATILILLCGCNSVTEKTSETVTVREVEFESTAGISTYLEDDCLHFQEYDPVSELNGAQAFLIGLNFNIDEMNYGDYYEGAPCYWFHFRNTLADGGIIYCNDIYYIDYAVFLDDGTLDAAESFRCNPGELIQFLAEMTVNEKPS